MEGLRDEYRDGTGKYLSYNCARKSYSGPPMRM
jgi:hypothetical protein